MNIVRGMLPLLFAFLALLSGSTCSSAEQVEGRMFYTAANIWYEHPGHIESTNYHKGAVLAIGTKVTVTDVIGNMIRFVGPDGTTYKLIFLPQRALTGATVWDLFKQYFSENDPAGKGGAFSALTPREQENVRQGKIRPGMSREAVLMAYGYPPGHRTPSLTADKWVYWENRYKTRAVWFRNDRVVDPAAEPQQQETASLSECIQACKENTKRTPEQCFDACNRQ